MKYLEAELCFLITRSPKPEEKNSCQKSNPKRVRSKDRSLHMGSSPIECHTQLLTSANEFRFPSCIALLIIPKAHAKLPYWKNVTFRDRENLFGLIHRPIQLFKMALVDMYRGWLHTCELGHHLSKLSRSEKKNGD
jgi:hypothetical protein